MKIAAAPIAIRMQSEAQDRDADQALRYDGQPGGDPQQKKQHPDPERGPDPVDLPLIMSADVALELIQQEIESLDREATEEGHGVHAEQSGVGPGLRVTLKGKEGQVLRQLSGQEFLKLRQEKQLAKSSKRGRLLDQKA